MTHVSQHLHEAFPDQAETISRLKAEDAHFQALAAQFDTIDHEVAEAETGSDPASDERIEALKKARLALLDDIAAYLATAEQGA